VPSFSRFLTILEGIWEANGAGERGEEEKTAKVRKKKEKKKKRRTKKLLS
jgi:hypothetical protein